MNLDEARRLDAADPLKEMRNQFHIPTHEVGGRSEEDVYFVGNSLGLMPRRVDEYLQVELEKWKSLGVRGHFEGEQPWVSYHELLAQPMANLVGAKVDEVITMNTLTVNLHLMMATFYRPTRKGNNARNKILIEDHAFPSDQNAVESQVKWHGLDPVETIIRVAPNEGEQLISTEKIVAVIEQHSASLAVVLLPGVQYYTGQVFDMKAITRAAKQFDIVVGFDLAHAAGNIPLELHDWDVDFAAWCTYKYLNSGAGSMAGCFIHERHASNQELNRLAGWWGHDKSTRFLMDGKFNPIPTAEGWQLSNPPILSLAAIRASLDVFESVGDFSLLREKSVAMNRFFRDCLKARLGDRVQTITPLEQSGCQLSLEVNFGGVDGKAIYEQLEARGIRTDWREPNVIRAAPVPLYNSFEEIWKFVETLDKCLQES